MDMDIKMTAEEFIQEWERIQESTIWIDLISVSVENKVYKVNCKYTREMVQDLELFGLDIKDELISMLIENH